MNVITFVCPKCRIPNRVPVTDAGCQVTCQDCKRLVKVPELDKAASPPNFLTKTITVPVWKLVASASLILIFAAFLVGQWRSTPAKIVDVPLIDTSTATVPIDAARLISNLIGGTYFKFTWGPGLDGIGEIPDEGTFQKPQTIKFKYDGKRLKRVEFTFIISGIDSRGFINNSREYKTLSIICQATPDERATMRACLELLEQKQPLAFIYPDQVEEARRYPGRITGQLRIELTVHENQATFTFLPP